ncbi:MAG: hypothetical protein HY067_03570 [Betaproteobacteria bacterium]|nr:hypothetical protein [Betaproteobacteria bacterium]
MIRRSKSWRRSFANSHFPFNPEWFFLALFFLRVLRVLRGSKLTASSSAALAAPLPRGFGIVVAPQSAALAFCLALRFQIGLAVFDRQFAQALRKHPGRTFPDLFKIDVDTVSILPTMRP